MTTMDTRPPRPRPGPSVSARALASHLPDGVRQRLAAREAAVGEPYVGITQAGAARPGLFPIGPTGVPTGPIAAAAEAFRASLDAVQRAAVQFPVDSDTWRRWSNVHRFLMRHGLCLDDLSDDRRGLVLAILEASLSASGYKTARDVMRLNHTIGEMTDRLGDEYGEWLYWLSLFGEPSPDQPWGWQIDGHHLNVNCLLLGDQLVMTPMFLGSEPTFAESGIYAGTRVFEAEEQGGLTLMRSLPPELRQRASLGMDLPSEVLGAAFRDNFDLRYEGVRCGDLSAHQQALLVRLIETYVGRMRPGHAEIKLAEVRQHLAETYFAWIGGVDDRSAFYYRVHSPVILIEFDHQAGVALDNDEPARSHIHTVVRTPNGNDYGMDLLRQHYQRFDHNGDHSGSPHHRPGSGPA